MQAVPRSALTAEQLEALPEKTLLRTSLSSTGVRTRTDSEMDPGCPFCQAYGEPCMVHKTHDIDEVVVIGNAPCVWCGSVDCDGECIWNCRYCGSPYCNGECQWTYYCDNCGSPYCYGECRNQPIGGGSGGGYYPPQNPPTPPDPDEEIPHIAPQADEDLKEELQKMLDFLKKAGLGAKMLQKLNSLLQGTDDEVFILLTKTRPQGCEETDLGRTFYDKNGNVYCYVFEDHLPTLYEEVGHAFQSKNHPHEISVHREMEVKMMVYDFNTQNGLKFFGERRDWDIINDYSNGQASAAKAKRALRRLGYDVSDFDPNTFHTNNLNELRNQ